MNESKKANEIGFLIREISSWEDLQRTCQSLTEKQKGDLFEHLVKAYLQLEPEYVSKLKHVWLVA